MTAPPLRPTWSVVHVCDLYVRAGIWMSARASVRASVRVCACAACIVALLAWCVARV